MKSLAELRSMLKSPQYEPLLGPCIDDILKNEDHSIDIQTIECLPGEFLRKL